MGSLYLIRHGQAGLRQHYDTLSGLGRRQACLLGRFLAHQGIQFQSAYSGALNRQQETAAEVRRAFLAAGGEFPEISTDVCWNEFDLDGVYADYAPRLAEVDPEFRGEHLSVLRALEDPAAAVHRQWTRCDTLVMRAWIEGRYPCRGETFAEFQSRVMRALQTVGQLGRGQSAVVFTSATPIAIWVSHALGVNNGRLMRLAGVIQNSSVTTLRMDSGQPALFTFNNASHLDRAELRTFR